MQDVFIVCVLSILITSFAGYVAGCFLIDYFFYRQEEIINRMTEKGDV